MALRTRQEAAETAQTGVISEKLEDTFGPNPCTSLKLQHDNGQLIETGCDSKRCEHCSPRKQAKMQMQLQTAFGEYTYVLRVADPSKIIARLKKQNDRHKLGWIYQSVGDDYLGYILISNLPIIENQNRTSLQDWLSRVIQQWLKGDKRVRRSRSLTSLSLFTLRVRKSASGDNRPKSPWRRLSRWTKEDIPLDDPLTEDEKRALWKQKRKAVDKAILLKDEKDRRRERERVLRTANYRATSS